MKKIALFLSLLLLLLAVSGCGQLQSSDVKRPVSFPSGESVTLSGGQAGSSTQGGSEEYSYIARFLMINDNHGAFTSESGESGVARLDTLFTMLESVHGEYVKIANGDLLQGSCVSNSLHGRPMIDALNEMDFTCFVIGNHEFDWGIEKIAEYADGNPENGEADFPFLGANIVCKDSRERPEWLEPYTVVEQNGLKIGIIGVLGAGLESSILSSKVSEYEFLPYTTMVGEYAAELRAQGCDSVVLATHEYETSINKTIATLSGDQSIDAIFCGHTHQKINETVSRADGYPIPVLQNYGNGDTASELLIDYSAELPQATAKQYNVRSYDPSAEMTAAVIEKYQDLITASKAVITVTETPLSKSALGVLSCDSMAKAFSADLGVINTSGIRSAINSTTVTAADLFKAFPFDNQIVLVTVSGAEVKNFYNKSGSYLYFNEGFTPSAFSDKENYTIAVIDYVFESPYYSYIFKNSTHQYTERTLRDVLTESFSG